MPHIAKRAGYVLGVSAEFTLHLPDGELPDAANEFETAYSAVRFLVLALVVAHVVLQHCHHVVLTCLQRRLRESEERVRLAGGRDVRDGL